MPEFIVGGVGVHVGPDFTGFSEEVDSRLEVIERELDPVEIKLVANLMAGFRKEAEAKAKEALKGVTVGISLEPNTRGFRTETARLVKEVSDSIVAEIRVAPKLSKGFKGELRAQVDEATRDFTISFGAKLAKDFRAQLRADVEKATKGNTVALSAELSKGFAKELRAEIDKATKGIAAKVQIAPSLTSDFRSKLKALVKEASAEAISVNVTVNPENVEDIRRKLKAAVLEAANGLTVRVAVEPIVGSFAAKLRAAVDGISVRTRARVPVTAAAEGFGAELVTKVKGAVEVAKKYAIVPVKLAVQGGARAIGGVQAVLAGTLGVVKKLAIGFGILGAAIGLIGAAGVKSAADLELERKALQTLLQSDVKGSKLFKGLQTVAVETPFEVPDITPLAKQLVVIHNTLGGNGFALDRILPSVKIVTDLSAALGVAGANVNKVGLALGKIAGRGKLTSEELRSISKNLPGFSAIQAVATKLGVTVPEAFDKVRAGAVDSKTAIDAILEGMRKFPGAAGAAAKMAQQTFKGALSNFPDILRNTFFNAFQDELPKLTTLIGPHGQLVSTLNATLPAVAAAFTPLATEVLALLARFGPVLSHLVTATLPIIVSLVRGIGNLAPAFDSFISAVQPILGPIGMAFRRLASVIATTLVPAFQKARPYVKQLGDAVVQFLGYLGQVVVVLAPLIPLLVQIGTTLVNTIGRAGVPVAKAFAAAFTILAPVLEDVVRGLGAIVTAAAPLLPVIAKVAAVIGEALVGAFAKIDWPPLIDALGQVAVAVGQIIVALTPLIPVAAQIVTILAQELVPILTVMAPVVTAVVTALGPLLIVLARMAPLLLTVFAVEKVRQWGSAIAEVGTLALSHLGGVGDKLFDLFGGIDWANVRGKVIAGASIVTAGLAGVMAGSATDTTTKVTSIVGIIASIGTALATGNPVMAAVAAGTAVLGYFFGQAQKRAKEAAKAQSEYNTEVAGLRSAFEQAGVTKFSSEQAKALVIARNQIDLLKKTGPAADIAKAAYNELGVSFERVAVGAGLAGDAAKRALGDEVDRAVQRTTDSIMRLSQDGRTNFGSFTDAARDAAKATALAFLPPEAVPDPSNLKVVTDSIRGYYESMGQGRAVTEKVNEAQARFRQELQQRLADSPAAQYIESLPAKTRAALVEQTRLAKVQQFITDEQDRQRGSAKKFADAYDTVNNSVSSATTAYKDWLTGLQGSAAPLADVKLSILDYAKQLLEVRNSTDLSPFEKQQKDLQLVAQAQDSATDALGRFVSESGGHYDVFTGKVNTLKLELINGLSQSLGISNQQAELLVAQILQIPDEKHFKVLSDTTDAVTDLSDLQKRVTTYITSNISNTAFLDATDPTQKAKVINAFIEQYEASDPKAKAYLDTLDVKDKEKFVKSVLAGIDGSTATATVKLNITSALAAKGQIIESIKNFAGFAAGGIITGPQVALIGEAGQEIILPMTDPKRMAELLRQAGVTDSLAATVAAQLAGARAAAPAALAAGGIVGAAPAPLGAANAGAASVTMTWVVNNEGLDVWAAATAKVFADTEAGIIAWTDRTVLELGAWPGRVSAASLPPLLAWEAAVVGSFTAMLAQLTGMATSGGNEVVAALRASLSVGSSAVTSIVHDYAVKLANALNPVLEAVGGKPIAVKAFREGGVAEATPRIVADGAYAVHVFGEQGTRGEAYIPFDPALRPRSRSIADETVRRLGGQVQWFRDGGISSDRIAAAKSYAVAEAGKPYVFGAVGPNAFDCSGLWSAIVNVIRSQPPNHRLFNSSSLIDGYAGLGFIPGLGQVSLGAKKGNPGHVAGTIAGLNAEATPPRVLVGPAARGADAALFTNQFHLGTGYFVQGGAAAFDVPAPPATGHGQLGSTATAAMLFAAAASKSWAAKNVYDAFGLGTTTGDQGVPQAAGALGHILATIRAVESGGNYRAHNPVSSASGAYQFTNGTWGRYGGFPAAFLAPPSVQDAKAAANVSAILSRYHGILEAVPAAWYTGSYAGHGHLNYRPPGPGNPASVQQYVDHWLEKYGSLPGHENGGLSTVAHIAHISERNKPELILPLTKPSRVRELADQHGLTDFLMSYQQARDDRPNLSVTVVPPAANDPETYAASLRNRLAPLVGTS